MSESAKESLRKQFILRRQQSSASARAAMSLTVARNAVELPEIASARGVNIYIPMPLKAELDTLPLIERLLGMNKIVTVPIVKGSELVSAQFHSSAELQASPLGNPQPRHPEPADESLIDAVVIPLLAVDRKGCRLGFGKGYYDRFLARLSDLGYRPCRIGLAFSFQMTDFITPDPWDQNLDILVHEQGAVHFSNHFH
ncbi:MAG: 5-formyltetrahydrofolate cyclo-ligase [Candidatus Chlorobium antarcticum]|jgi:5-formyltetrahydrofolate cyclo-ligase|nr:5-formyltetrahydrofolate cyclo-ligase [Candidatus Chlorobium antarcticum]